MILSVGCGTKIIPEVDVYLDLYPVDSKERKAAPGKITIPHNKKFIQGDVQDMHMFKDKQFDYAYAEHVLEHVDYPEKACKELQRVAKAGLIKTPSSFSEIFFGWEYHKWLALERGGKIFFFQKRENENIPFGRFFREVVGKNKKYDNKIIPQVKQIYDTKKYLFDTVFKWKDKFEFEVVREK